MASWTWVTWVSACLAFLMTSFLVTSRASLMWLLRLYKYEQIHPATWYTAVAVLLLTPHLAHLVKLVWDTPILSPANRQPLPRAARICIGIFGSVLEGIAMAVFATEVTPVLPEPVLVTLPYATLAFYLMTSVSKHLRKPEAEKGQEGVREPSPWQQPCLMKEFWYLMASLYTLCAPLAVGVLLNLWSSFRFNIPECTTMVIAMITAAGVWNPDVQKATITSSKSKNRCQMVELIYIPLRIISIALTVFTCLLFKVKDFRQNMTVFLSPVLVDFQDYRIWLPVVLCIVCGFLCLMCSIAASKMGLVTAGIKVPLFLCPMLAMVTVIATWNDFQTNAFWELWGTDSLSWTAFGLSIITWLIPFCFPVFGILKSPCVPGRDVMQSFISFSWQTFFMEPKLILNYERCSIGKACHCSQAKVDVTKDNAAQRRKVVFICTTMYKESEKEMRRYMNSIKDVISNHRDHTVDIEAHVFFDGSVEDGRVNTRGRHLVELLCETFDIAFDRLEKNKTPYGCQLHTGSLLAYPVYIHFKDTSEVKAKKRWSQVMYLHYLLQFRCRKSFDQSYTIKPMNQDAYLHVSKDTNATELVYANINTNLNNEKNAQHFSKNSSPNISLGTNQNCFIHKRQAQKQNLEGSVPEHSKVQDSPSLDQYDCLTLNPRRYLQTTAATKAGSKPVRASIQGPCSTLVSKLKATDRGVNVQSSTAAEEPGTKIGPALLPVGTPSSSTDSASSPWPQPDWNLSALEDVYLLATDADTEFTSISVEDVLSQCQEDKSLGAVCGRTVPEGSAKPIVWYQKFEYAKDFWLVKASQNVIGSVTCCPGCFSLYRASAIAQVCHTFSQPTASAFDSMVKDHGEDRWLCTLLMQRGWRLAYSAHAHNSTHCPETVGEFLRQRRRWVLSELSNMAAIFMSMPRLVRYNQSFSSMFIVSLLMTFMWVITSPSTTLVFLCVGGDVLFSVSPCVTLPLALLFFLLNTVVCCAMAQSRQKLAVMASTVVMATAVLCLSVGFVLYVVRIMESDLQSLGSVQFRPYFLVFLLVLAIVYAALLHPREGLSLLYGLSYALLFPAMFVVLPVYALANMVDQSWGTREVGTRGCCQQPQEEEEDDAYKDFSIETANLVPLADREGKEFLEETSFWSTLKSNLIGVKVNTGVPGHILSEDLRKLRVVCVTAFVGVNLVWFVCLGLLHLFAGSDVICYLVATIFSFSLLLQLTGLTSYKCNSLIKKYLARRNALALTFDMRV